MKPRHSSTTPSRPFLAPLRFYAWTLKQTIRFKPVTMLVSATPLAGTVYLFTIVPTGFLSADIGQLNGQIEAAQGIGYQALVEHMKRVMEILKEGSEHRRLHGERRRRRSRPLCRCCAARNWRRRALAINPRYRSALGVRLTEPPILVTAMHYAQAVEWAIHSVIAAREGIGADTIAAIERPAADGDGHDEALVHDARIEPPHSRGSGRRRPVAARRRALRRAVGGRPGSHLRLLRFAGARRSTRRDPGSKLRMLAASERAAQQVHHRLHQRIRRQRLHQMAS